MATTCSRTEQLYAHSQEALQTVQAGSNRGRPVCVERNFHQRLRRPFSIMVPMVDVNDLTGPGRNNDGAETPALRSSGQDNREAEVSANRVELANRNTWDSRTTWWGIDIEIGAFVGATGRVLLEAGTGQTRVSTTCVARLQRTTSECR